MSVLEQKSLSKSYGDFSLKDIDLEVSSGEFLSIVGPSGCGKSTILRIIAGLENLDSGEIKINGKAVNGVSPQNRDIAMVFQSYALYPHMSVEKNISSGLRHRGFERKEIAQRVSEVAETLDLGALMSRKPQTLSGGQRQRVALARALVRKPSLFLLDEPLSNLDAQFREKVRGDLKQIFQSQSAPVIYVTHDQLEAMSLSSRVVVMKDGVVQQVDSPATIYSKPANSFVAGFMGSPRMNLIELKAESKEVRIADVRVPLPEAAKAASRVTLGIRPEDVEVREAGLIGSLSASVVMKENLGDRLLLTLELESSSLGQSTQGRVKRSDEIGRGKITLRALVPASQSLEERVSLNFTETHWFDTESGNYLQ